MNEDTFNMSIRRYLKTVGVHSQHEIEKAVAAALADRRLAGNEKLSVKMTLRLEALGVDVDFDGEIELE